MNLLPAVAICLCVVVLLLVSRGKGSGMKLYTPGPGLFERLVPPELLFGLWVVTIAVMIWVFVTQWP